MLTPKRYLLNRKQKEQLDRRLCGWVDRKVTRREAEKTLETNRDKV